MIVAVIHLEFLLAQPLKTALLRNNFLADIKSAKKLVDEIQQFSVSTPAVPCNLHIKQVHRVVGLAFMGLIAEWEEFLEQTFIRYLSNGQSKNGFKAPHKIGQSLSLIHISEPTRPY